MVGMAVSSDGVERISQEIEEPLCFVGDWEGIYQTPFGVTPTEQHKVTIIKGRYSVFMDAGAVNAPCQFVDEGKCKCRMVINSNVSRGIYKRENGRLFLCFGRWNSGGHRPSDFRVCENQDIYILHPVKPPKK